MDMFGSTQNSPRKPGEVTVSNDPFLSHAAPVGANNRRATPAMAGRAGAPPQEMVNVASDAFMTHTGGAKGGGRGQGRRTQHMVTVRVSIISAKNLRPADWMTGKSDPYVVCQIPGKSRSQFRTKTINSNVNPTWGEYGHPLPGWVPGDPIEFKVYDSDALKTDDSLGKALIESKKFYPNGSGVVELTLKDDTHTHETISTLTVQIEVFGVTAGDRLELGIMKMEDGAERLAKGAVIGLEDAMDTCAKMPGEAIDLAENVIGDGDPERKSDTLWTYVMVPWGSFVWVYLCWIILRHFTQMGTTLLTLLAFAMCIGAIITGVAYKRGEKSVPLSTMGVLCLVAVIGGVWVGHHGWNTCWRQTWWTFTGIQYEGNTASVPAAARIDAAWVGFKGSTGAKNTLGRTSVDTFRAAGFRDKGNWYCAAPILQPDLIEGTIWTRVEYWAIGIDCCQDFGSFTCDAAREYQGGYGVVMLDGGMPCAGCYADKFRKAAAKAEGTFNLVSSPGVRYVRFVRTPGAVRNEYVFYCLLNFMGSLLGGLVFFFILGKLCHFKGVGKKGKQPNFSWKALIGKAPMLS